VNHVLVADRDEVADLHPSDRSDVAGGRQPTRIFRTGKCGSANGGRALLPPVTSGTSEKLQAGLRVDSARRCRAAGIGAAIVSGDVEAQHVHRSGALMTRTKCRPRGTLDARSRRSNGGSKWERRGRQAIPGESNAAPEFDLLKTQIRTRAWHRVLPPELPTVQSPDWPRAGLDHLSIPQLEAAGWEPADDVVDRAALVRRFVFRL